MYYNYAMLPSCVPHELINLVLIQNGDLWKIKGKGYENNKVKK